MKNPHLIVFMNIFSILILGAASRAADKEPTAVLWQDNGVATIEATVPGQLAAGTNASIQVYRKEGDVSKRILNRDNVPDCGADLAVGEVCKRSPGSDLVQFRYRFSTLVGSKATYQIGYFFTEAKTGDLGRLMDVSQIIPKEKPEVKPFVAEEKKEFATEIRGMPNGEIRITIHPAADAGSMSLATKKYVDERMEAVHGWLETHLINPRSVAKVQIEPRTKPIPGNVPYVYEVMGLRLDPDDADVAVSRQTLNVVMVTNKKFPVGEYDLAIDFPADAPAELAGTRTNTQTGEGLALPKPSEVGKNDDLGLRELATNLDVGGALTSSVKDVTEGGVAVRKRNTQWAIDLRFAPWLNRRMDDNFERFWTPIFIDAKISGDKIDKDTLSLNRIIFGTKYSIRGYHSGSNNIFVYSFTGQSVSDRDFKRAEADFNFEFKPLIYKWNSELKNRLATEEPSVLIKDHGSKVFSCCKFGYRVQPLVGFDLGYTYRTKRAAFDVENGDHFVRRLYFGADILLNLTQHLDMELSDTFYIRGEATTHRTRNYFFTEVQLPISISSNLSHCVFIRFDRGDKPPFSTPGVNALKVGYRVTSNFLHRR